MNRPTSTEMTALTAAAVMATVTIEVERSPIVTSLESWLLDNLFFKHLSSCVTTMQIKAACKEVLTAP
jgi:hypothetical protein